MYKILLLSSLLYSFLLNASNQYYEIVEEDTLIFNISTIMESDKTIRVYENNNRKHYTVFDSTFNTIKYEFEDISDNSRIVVNQIDGKIVLKGILNGKEISSELINDDVKWSQSITYTLHRFMFSKEEVEVFRIFRPDNFEPIIFKAVKAQIDTVMINNAEIPVQKILLRAKGFKSVFWKGEYNFRISDGLFIKYIGKNGGPGSTETLIILKE
jgi:hypothetical protein